MEKFRNLTKNIFFKIFLSFLGLTFVVFGVGDFIIGSSSAWIAKVDGNKISYNEFLSTLQSNKERIYRSSPNEDVLQYLNSSNFRQDIVKSIVNQRITKLLQDDFGVYPDKSLVLQGVVKHPGFRNSEGSFNRVAFINYLKINNLSEDKFIQDLSNELSGQIIFNSLSYNPISNSDLVKEVYAYKEETRMADIISISVDNVGEIKSPTQDELSEFFTKNRDKFILPESRKISYVEFSEKDIMPEIKVSDSDVVSYHKESPIYIKPTTKDFYHLLFDDEFEANKFLNMLDKKVKEGELISKAFLELALELKGRNKEDILLQSVTNQDLLPEIIDDVFNLKVGKYSSVLKSSLGFHIFYFVQQNPEFRQELTADLKKEIRENLLLEKREEIFTKKMEDIDDKILTSNSLKEVAKEFNLTVKSLDKINKDGLNSSKVDIAQKVGLDGFTERSFSLAQNESSEVLFSKSNNKYYIVFVDEVDELRIKTLDEVRNLATQLFIKEKKKEQLIKLSSDINNQIQSNVSVSDIIRNNNLKVVRNKVFPRFYLVNSGEKDINYANNFLQDLFTLGVGGFTRPHPVSEDEMHIGVLKSIISPNVDKNKIEELKKRMVSEFKNNIIESYDNYLQVHFPVEINYKMLNNNDEV